MSFKHLKLEKRAGEAYNLLSRTIYDTTDDWIQYFQTQVTTSNESMPGIQCGIIKEALRKELTTKTIIGR